MNIKSSNEALAVMALSYTLTPIVTLYAAVTAGVSYLSMWTGETFVIASVVQLAGTALCIRMGRRRQVSNPCLPTSILPHYIDGDFCAVRHPTGVTLTICGKTVKLTECDFLNMVKVLGR